MAKATKTNRTRPPNSSGDDRATAWAMEIVAGRIVAGPHVRNAARRHLDDLKHGPKRGLTWDLPAAQRAIRFFEGVLRLNGGQFEGKPFLLHPSQAFRIGSLFGWKKSDGTRRFRRFYDEEGKGSGKSPLMAGIGLYCLVADGEARAEVYAAGSKKDQAMVLFRDAVAMVDQSPALSDKIVKSGGNPVWNLAYVRSSSWFRPISSEDGQSGPRPSCALVDEIHEHKDGRVIEMLERGFKWRRQPLLVMATNAGFDRNSVCWGEHQHAVRVAAGTRTPDEAFSYVGEPIDDETFAFVCSLDAGDDPLADPACWAKANPLLGVTVKEDYLASVVKQAKAIPGKLNNILRLHFCVWTDAESAWMGRAALESVLDDFDPETEHEGAAVYAGADLSATKDLSAVAFVVETEGVDMESPEGGTVRKPTYDAWVEAWTPEATALERAIRDHTPYDAWIAQGFMNTVPGRVIRMDFLASRVAEIGAIFDLRGIAYDAYAFKRYFEPALDEAGVTAPVFEHPQGGKRRAKPTPEQVAAAQEDGGEAEGLWMPGSLATLETLILERRIRIRTNPVTISAIMGATIEEDAFGNRWFSKRRATTRIDPLVALAMAVGLATAQEPIPFTSAYEAESLVIV